MVIKGQVRIKPNSQISDCGDVVFSDLILTDLIFSLITDSVVVTSQRLTMKSWPQL